jgi:intracellular septation protein A
VQFLLAILPLVAFYVGESLYGLKAGVAAAMGFALLEVGVGYWRTRRIQKMGLFALGLVLVLGGLSLVSDDERFVLWGPVIGDLVFAGVLLGSLLTARSLLEVAWDEARDEALDDVMRRFLRGLTVRFALNLVLHAAITAWATTQSRETWLFVSGPVQYGLFGIQIALEAVLVWRLPPEEAEPNDVA